MTNTTPQPPHVRIRRERKYRPLDAGVFHLLTTFTAPPVSNPDRQRPPLDVSFVVDRSGSMSGGALELARRVVEHALQILDERDSVSLVVYDNTIDTLLTQRRCDGKARDKAVRRLRRVHPRGSTDLAGGWLTGCDQLAPLADRRSTLRGGEDKPLCRALLLTDGLANVGITSPEDIRRHAFELARRGITTSTFGVGARYDETLLAGMADAGRGHFHHIPHAGTIPQVFAGELGELLQVAMREVTVGIRLPSGWRLQLLNDLPIETLDGWQIVRLGELSSNEARSLTWALDLPQALAGASETCDIRISWTTADGQHTHEHVVPHTVEARVYPGEADHDVLDQLATLRGARARAEALRLNRQGDYATARRLIEEALLALPDTATGRDVAAALRQDALETMSMPMSPAEMKRHYAATRNVQRGRRDDSAQ